MAPSHSAGSPTAMSPAYSVPGDILAAEANPQPGELLGTLHVSSGQFATAGMRVQTVYGGSKILEILFRSHRRPVGPELGRRLRRNAYLKR
ncbi:hypothetical protein NM208_g16948 [Fusarium decemcellulare]|uniref:Uncharacterized protein n=1 Tax=Fusarium decemcellulare TaxID=57161 RepID=A0ACC1R9A6_9HYPO|nr:hypothetical protein NM208_g16948 [Fusarium decemcellulare]